MGDGKSWTHTDSFGSRSELGNSTTKVAPQQRSVHKSSSAGTSLKDWLDAMDAQWLSLLPPQHQPSVGVRDYLSVLEDRYDSPEQIFTLYLRRGAGPLNENILDNAFFDDIGMGKIGQRRVVNKWVATNT